MASSWWVVCRTAGRGALLGRLPAAAGWQLHQRSALLLLQLQPATQRAVHISCRRPEKELHRPSSKVEESVESLKDQLKDTGGGREESPQREAGPASVPVPAAPPAPPSLPPEQLALAKEPPRRSLWVRFVDEVKHYYHGFKLLFININISRKLVWKLLNGQSLTRREGRQLVRTVTDLFRVLPFSVFIIIPFMELLLPVALKLFPNMLPSTFQTANAEEAKMKQRLKVKLETAKFLQKTLDSMALKGKGHYSDTAREFADFFKEIRTSGEQASNEQILKFSKLFEDEVTLDSLERPELTALCRVLEIPPFGTSNFLRFMIQMKLRGLKADDRIIYREGVETMTVEELQAACRARGMRAYGVSVDRLRSQLSQWLDLSLNEKVPPSLLLLSRALYLPDSLPAGDQLKVTIARLPEAVGTATKAAIGDREGRVDFKTRVDVVKEEERKILQERAEAAALAEAAAAEKRKAELLEPEREPEPEPEPAAAAEETLRDRAPVLADRAQQLGDQLTSRDVSEIEHALETLAANRRKLLLEQEELEDIKEEMADYEEDVRDLHDIMTRAGKKMSDLKETRAARHLQYSVNRMINSIDSMIDRLQDKEKKLLAQHDGDARKTAEEVRIQEVIQALQHIQSIPDKTKLNTIAQVLSKMDDNEDGSIRVEDIYDVIELMGQDNFHLSRGQMEEIVELLDREKVLDLERRIEKSLQREAEDIAAAAAAAERAVTEKRGELTTDAEKSERAERRQ